MRELSLFTGAGGGLLGTMLLGWTPVGYVEYNDYAQQVIRQRIDDGILPNAPIFGDIRTFLSDGYAASYTGMVDVVTGGFPCQPFSSASRGRKTARDFWPEMRQVVKIAKPPFVFAENVTRHAIDVACADLRRLGYETRKIALSAADLGADHIRQRYWLLAYTNSNGELRRAEYAEMAQLPRFCSRVWESYTEKSGMANGVAYRVDRLKSIGNGQVPVVAATAWQLLTEDLE